MSSYNLDHNPPSALMHYFHSSAWSFHVLLRVRVVVTTSAQQVYMRDALSLTAVALYTGS